MDELWKQVVENNKLLDSCKLHDFEDITPERKIGKKYKCKNCNGVLINGINAFWYNKGLEHGRKTK